jgi:ATP-dependent DNA ligase
MPNPTLSSAFELSEWTIGAPMLCHAGSLDVVPDDPNLLASWKEDGWRALATTADGGGSVLRTREGHPITAVPYIADYLTTLAPAGSVFDGELVDRARPRQLRRTGTILKSAAAHVPTAADPAITFAIFDVLFIAGEDLRDQPLHERLRRLNALIAPYLPDLAADAAHAIVLLEHVPSTPGFAQAALDAGKEGIVVKHRNSLYRHGSRSDWWRYKPQETIDARCTGVV